jgi:hypothetical protein
VAGSALGVGIIQTPFVKMNKKPKNPEKYLFIAIGCCLGMGLILIAFTLRCYIKHEPDNYYVGSQKPVPAYVSDDQFLLLHLFIYQLFPVVGASFLFIIYLICKYLRRKKQLKCAESESKSAPDSK